MGLKSREYNAMSMYTLDSKRRRPQALALLGWIALTFCASLSGVFVSRNNAWYAQLNKPFWTPPDGIFGPVWTGLCLLMAVAAWMVWRRDRSPSRQRALGLYLVQLAMNALWSPIFFGLQRPGLALLWIVLLLIVLAATLLTFRIVRPAAAILLLPYGVWVGFATLLNLAIWRMNPGG